MEITQHVSLSEACARGLEAEVDSALMSLMAAADPHALFEYVNAIDPSGLTPLVNASCNGHLKIVQKLLRAGAVVDQRLLVPHSDGVYSALVGAIVRGYAEIVKELVIAGADVNQQSFEFGFTPLFFAARYRSDSHRSSDIIDILVDAGASVNEMTPLGTPLSHAFRQSSLETCEKLIARGARLDLVAPNGRTVLHCAALSHDEAAAKIEYLFSSFPEISNRLINSQDTVHSATPLHCAVRSGNLRAFVLMLFSPYIDVRRTDTRGGRTPLRYLMEKYPSLDVRIDPETRFLPAAISGCVGLGDVSSWSCVPSPCPGLEMALFAVWREAPDQLPRLFERLETSTKEDIRAVLRLYHRRLPGLKPELKMKILGMALSDWSQVLKKNYKIPALMLVHKQHSAESSCRQGVCGVVRHGDKTSWGSCDAAMKKKTKQTAEWLLSFHQQKNHSRVASCSISTTSAALGDFVVQAHAL